MRLSTALGMSISRMRKRWSRMPQNSRWIISAQTASAASCSRSARSLGSRLFQLGKRRFGGATVIAETCRRFFEDLGLELRQARTPRHGAGMGLGECRWWAQGHVRSAFMAVAGVSSQVRDLARRLKGVFDSGRNRIPVQYVPIVIGRILPICKIVHI